MTAEPSASGGSGLRRAVGAAALILPLGVALALPFITSERMAVPPLATAGLAAGAVALLATLGGGAGRRMWDLPAAALLGLLAGHLLFAPGVPRGHDLMPHFWGAWGFFQEMRGGDLFPRWLHQVGLGLPLLQFYGPVSFYLMVPAAALGAAPAVAFKSAFLVAGALAAMTMYGLVARWTGDRRAALVAAAGYSFAPYRLLDVNYRVALGESVAFVALPLVFGAMLALLRQGGRRRLAFAALAVAFLALIHPLTTVMAAVALGLWVSLEWFPGRAGVSAWLGRLGILAVAFALGLALAGFFVLPVVAETRFTTIGDDVRIEGDPGPPLLARHGLRPTQLVERRLWSRLLGSDFAGAERDGNETEMPFYAGLALLSLLPVAAGLGRLPGEGVRPRGRFATGAVLAGVALGALALTLSPAAAVLAHLPALAKLQFPWRFLTIASFAFAAAAGFATARLLAAWPGQRWTALLPGVVSALLIADGFPFTGAADWFPGYHGLAHFYRSSASCGGRWGCWQWHPVSLPPGPVRVMGSFLPPADWSLEVAGARPGYPEFFNRAARRRFASAAPADPAPWGVWLTGGPRRPEVKHLAPTAYARWLPGAVRGAWQRPGEPRPYRRGGGRIEVGLDGRPGTVVLLEEYFHGWEVETPAGWQDAEATRQGLLRAEVAAGQRTLRLRFSPWRWDRGGGWLLTGATALALFAPFPGLRRSGRGKERRQGSGG